jgi:hypothetical protein
MSNTKSATLSFRIEPELKEALRVAAEQEHRSIANMVEVMIREHCGRVGIVVAEPAPPGSAKRPAKSSREITPPFKKNA